MATTEVCERCGGNILKSYGEKTCLQCGFEPEFSTNGAEPPEISLRCTVRKEERLLLSTKPSQLRRRKRRLMVAGYSETEAANPRKP